MTPAALARFNLRKAAVVRAGFPATVEFTQNAGQCYECAFGEVSEDGGLHESGHGVQSHRTGALYWPRLPDHVPALLATFTILKCAANPTLVGSVWQIDRLATAAHEPVNKFNCHRCH